MKMQKMTWKKYPPFSRISASSLGGFFLFLFSNLLSFKIPTVFIYTVISTILPDNEKWDQCQLYIQDNNLKLI